MSKKYIFFLFLLVIAIGGVVATSLFLNGKDILILNPKGPISIEERNILATAVFLMFLLATPVFVALFSFVWWYRAENKKAKYTPDRKERPVADFIWWIPPSILIFTLSVLAWHTTHELDPYKPLESNTRPLTIQVVALPWRWLFIYPEQNIATVNFVEFPERTPVNFQLTADAPMNSFWIPQLGGQMYAMAGMSTQLRLMANTAGDFQGSAAEISGAGFAGMRFIARAVPVGSFEEWVQSVKESNSRLDLDSYNELAEPSMSQSPIFFGSTDEGLYNTIIMKFASPSSTASHMEGESHSQ